MKKSTVMFMVLMFFTVSRSFAAEMFEAYAKKYSLGYISDEINLRRWFGSAWGLEANVGLDDRSSNTDTDDGVTKSADRQSAHSYSFTVATVKSVKKFDYFDLNLKAGVGYGRAKSHSDPDGPDNSRNGKINIYSLFAGPEVEIKVPYFSRLVVVSSIQASYRVFKLKEKEETVAGPITTKNTDKLFNFRSDGNSLNGFFHLGVRYYF